MLHYAGLDQRIDAGIPAYEAALKAAGVDYQLFMYEGVNHAFNNDTSAARYDKAAADACLVAHRRLLQGDARLLTQAKGSVLARRFPSCLPRRAPLALPHSWLSLARGGWLDARRAPGAVGRPSPRILGWSLAGAGRQWKRETRMKLRSLAIAALGLGMAMAVPAVAQAYTRYTTDSVNFRAGPGVGYAQLRRSAGGHARSTSTTASPAGAGRRASSAPAGCRPTI